MPYAGDTYSLPPGTEATTATPIDSSDYNAFLADIAQAQNTARPIVGGGTGEQTAVGAHDALHPKGNNVASAATLNLNAATGIFPDITGTTAITAVTLSAGNRRLCRANGAFQLTASASLIVNGSTSVNYVCAVDDLILFEGYAGNVVRATTTRGGSVVTATASATEQLTGTAADKTSTPDSVAALWEKGSDVASASTITLGEGGLFHITGTTTITDIDFATAKDGRRATLIFDGVLTLTHNATTLKLPGGANITTAAGDRCVVVQDSGDNVVVESYTKADGTAVVAVIGWDMSGQTWQSPARNANNTAYQNTTGKPIMVSMSVVGSGTSQNTPEVSPDNSTWYKMGGGVISAMTPVFFIVPPGHYYRVSQGSSGSVSYWHEFR